MKAEPNSRPSGSLFRLILHPSSFILFFASFILPHARAADDTRAADAFFETKVRPLLVENCFKCHGEQKQKGSLRLDSRAGMLAGGERGPAIVPGSPEKSLLIRAVRQEDIALQMPPKSKLSKAQIDHLAAWIRYGAQWPNAEKAAATTSNRREFQITDHDRAYWAFQPVRRPAVPPVKNSSWPGKPLDHFILARLEAGGLAPNPAATRRTLIRRAFFDLIGLPPAPEEVEAFVNNRSADAWERLIDRLLARPQFGERWGRHWLDVVRFAQSNGYERDDEKPFAWRYRDYVIDAFNSDKPFNQFILEQLAGDELDSVTDAERIATGFYRLGVWDDEPDDSRQAVFDELDEIITTAGQAFLGLTVNCARCHDHKFDPISQRDYYALLSFIQNIKGYETPKYVPDAADFTLLSSAVKMLTKKANAPPSGWALAVREKGPKPDPTHLLIRGNAGTPGEEVQPAFLSVFPPVPVKNSAPRPQSTTCGRRRVLAEWIAGPSNPLTARVLVNRIWQHLFGRGIVATPNDFGKAGVPPTHPELLDWLAAEFVDGGWTIKRMLRLIMLSSTYQMSSGADRPDALAADEANDLFWRQSMRRLEAEAIRDAALVVSGDLNRQMGGRGFFPPLSREVIAGQSKPGFGWEIQHGADIERRSVYMFIKRNLMVPMLESFDYSNTSQPLGSRPVTTVAPQALMLLNSQFMQHQAERLADRISRESGSDSKKQIERAFAVALGRPPTDNEVQIALEYVRQQARALEALQLPITVTPKTPAALFDGYRRQMRPDDFIAGPGEGWSSHAGRWGNGYEGIDTAEATTGPFALYEPIKFGDGSMETQFMLHSTAQLGGILLRATPIKGGMRGYDMAMDPRAGTITLRRHDEKGATVLAQARHSLATNRWYKLRIEAAGPRIRCWVGERPVAPLLDAADPKPILGPGQTGIRTWGAASSAKDWSVRIGNSQAVVNGERHFNQTQARQQALRAFCLAMLNLNEFVYID
jgi:mono/diheme cytochrome c family protein